MAEQNDTVERAQARSAVLFYLFEAAELDFAARKAWNCAKP